MSDGKPFYSKPLPQTALNEFKTRLIGERVEGAKKQPTLAFGVVKNNPRLSIFTNVESDKDNGRLHAAMDAPTFFSFLQILEKVVESDERCGYKVECKRPIPPSRGERAVPTTVATVIVARDEEMCIFIGITARGITPVKFYFLPSNFHHLTKMDGSPVERREVTELYARGYLTMLSGLVPAIMNTHYVPFDPDEKKGGGNGGGWKGNNNSGGGDGWKNRQGQSSGGQGGGWDNKPKQQQTSDDGWGGSSRGSNNDASQGDDFDTGWGSDDLPM